MRNRPALALYIKPEAVGKHNEEFITRHGLDKYHPSERNLDTPVTAESEDVALFTDTHSDYTLGLKSLMLVIMCPDGHRQVAVAAQTGRENLKKRAYIGTIDNK